MRVMGIDPGYGITGWGVVETAPSLRAVQYGAILTDDEKPLYRRLHELQEHMHQLLEKYTPEAVVVENLYHSRNVTTSGGVYQARGVILSSVAARDLPLLELDPVTIKKAVTGNGRATKRDVTLMVRRLLSISDEIRPDDTADALAGAIAGSFAMQAGPMLESKFAKGAKRA